MFEMIEIAVKLHSANGLKIDIANWCEENCKEYYIISTKNWYMNKIDGHCYYILTYQFLNNADAVLFKLVWG
jgi:hypothetical protein